MRCPMRSEAVMVVEVVSQLVRSGGGRRGRGPSLCS